MRATYLVLTCAALCLVFAGTADARTYAGNLEVGMNAVSQTGTQEIKYHLNDDASTVTIEIKDGGSATVRTLDASEADPAQRPGTSQGLNVVEWDMKDDGGTSVPVGSYSFSIATTDVGYATWTNITPYQPGVVGVDVASPTDTVVSARFWSPNGLGVLKDKTDPNFGRIFVANGSGGTSPPYTSSATGAYHDKSGVYFLNCDLSDSGEGWLDDPMGTLFNTVSQYNPFKLNVDNDRGVFVCGGYSDGWEDLYIVDMDGSSYVTAFDRADYGLGNHDNMLHTAFTGTGSETVLWSNFEKDNSSYPSLASWACGWPISGTITAPYTVEIDYTAAVNGPENGIGGGTGSTIYSMRTICPSADENYMYFSNRRWGVSTVACAKMDITGPTAPQFVADCATWVATLPGGTTYGEKYGNFNSVDVMIDPVDSAEKLILQKYFGQPIPGGGYEDLMVYVADADDMSLLDKFATDFGVRAMCFPGQCVWDPVGNIIYSDITSEWLRVYAPPSAPFSFDIDYAGTFQVVQVTGLSEEDWEVYR